MLLDSTSTVLFKKSVLVCAFRLLTLKPLSTYLIWNFYESGLERPQMFHDRKQIFPNVHHFKWYLNTFICFILHVILVFTFLSFIKQSPNVTFLQIFIKYNENVHFISSKNFTVCHPEELFCKSGSEWYIFFAIFHSWLVGSLKVNDNYCCCYCEGWKWN